MGRRPSPPRAPRSTWRRKGASAQHHGLDGLLESTGILRGQRRLGDAEGEGEGAAARHDVAHDGNVRAHHRLEEQDGIAAPALVFEHHAPSRRARGRRVRRPRTTSAGWRRHTRRRRRAVLACVHGAVRLGYLTGATTTSRGSPFRKCSTFSTARSRPSRMTSGVWPALCGDSTTVGKPEERIACLGRLVVKDVEARRRRSALWSAPRAAPRAPPWRRARC